MKIAMNKARWLRKKETERCGKYYNPTATAVIAIIIVAITAN